LARPGLPAYRAELLARFRNPALSHKLQQIAMDGSQKLPQRLLGTIRARLADDASCERLCFALAGWLQYLTGRDDAGRSHAIADPLAEQLQRAATSSTDSLARVRALLGIEAVFGADLPREPRFVAALARHLEAIVALGTAAALRGVGH
jgi:fructuronate reductase